MADLKFLPSHLGHSLSAIRKENWTFIEIPQADQEKLRGTKTYNFSREQPFDLMTSFVPSALVQLQIGAIDRYSDLIGSIRGWSWTKSRRLSAKKPLDLKSG